VAIESNFPDFVVARGEKLPFAEFGIDVNHFFVGNGYVKLFTIPKGRVIGQHKHSRGHWSALLIGNVTMLIDGEGPWELTAPTRLWVEAGQEHAVEAKTDALWACIWDNPEGLTDPEAFDHEVTRS
jgi:quercetin dioxygenase-like cupin family protein